jgi:peptidoglycan/xylan/chitin deacetylase (PgdA/CDA1 family)
MNDRNITLITYHYVRPVRGSTFPMLKALELKDFESQLEYLSRTYQFVSAETVMALFNGQPVDLPPKPALLTFDDGYADHFRYVFPRLFDRKIKAAFYPTVTAAIDRQILDANRVHFVLASTTDPGPLIELIEHDVDLARRSYQLRTVDQYRAEFMTPSRFDEPRVAYVKRMLQFALPEGLRRKIADAAFRRFVTQDPSGFAEELYMGAEELRTLRASGMHIGLHGTTHGWLGKMSRPEQASEIKGSLRILELIGQPAKGFSFCFPYGSYNSDTIALLKEFGCSMALTNRSAVAQSTDSTFELPRLDTTELPRAG